MIFILEFIGTILHLAKSGRIIISVKKKLDPGTVLIDSKGNKIAKVIEIIGAVRSSYASAIPLTKNTSNFAGKRVGISSLVKENVERKR